jgi:hypothetical protein
VISVATLLLAFSMAVIYYPAAGELVGSVIARTVSGATTSSWLYVEKS